MFLLETAAVGVCNSLHRNMLVSAGVEDGGKKAKTTGNAKGNKGIWKHSRVDFELHIYLEGKQKGASWVK